MTEFVVFQDENGEVRRHTTDDEDVDDVDMAKEYNAVRVEKGRSAIFVPLDRVYRVKVQMDEYR